MIREYIEKLLQYGISKKFFDMEDTIYMRNRICTFLKVESYESKSITQIKAIDLQSLLLNITEWAFKNELIESINPPYSDLFDTELMDIICPRPSEINKKFKEIKSRNSKEALDWYYDYSKNTNYIRMDRVKKNIVWTQPSKFGEMVMTINLSKPEKDPKAIIEAAKKPSSSFPKCLLCIENVGYRGNLNHPARQTHRVLPLTLSNEEWIMQYSPYVYYNEHAIVINKSHVPMKITETTFERLFDFVDEFNHYFIGSNADLPLVGGSMLSHDHYQAGNYEMPMAKAIVKKKFDLSEYPDVNVYWLEWPMTVLRLSSSLRSEIIKATVNIMNSWKKYNHKEYGLVSNTDNTPHHTITPIARKRDGKYEIDIVLRSNIRSADHPDGVYHPHKEIFPVKKENIGLIEVMGLAVLPARLKGIVDELSRALDNNIKPDDIKVDGFIDIYKEMYNKFNTDKSSIDIVKSVIGEVFINGLTHCGVMKLDNQGEASMDRFIKHVNAEA